MPAYGRSAIEGWMYVSCMRLARTEVKYVMLMSGQLEKQSKLIVGSGNRGQTGAKPTVRRSCPMSWWPASRHCWLSSAARSLKTSCSTFSFSPLAVLVFQQSAAKRNQFPTLTHTHTF